MLVYSAIGTFNERLFQDLLFYSIKSNNLFSFYEKGCVENYNVIKECSHNILVDSGAFSMVNTNPNIKFDNYLKNYIRFIRKITDDEEVKGFFELDVGSLIPYSKVLNYRDELLAVSDKIIPVWHLYLGVDEFKKMVKNYSYVGIGGIVSNEINRNKLAPYVKYAHQHNCKIHGLGLTAQSILNKVPFYSVDSTNWLAIRFGNVGLFEKGRWKNVRLSSNYISGNSDKIMFLSYLNFIKFGEYYHKKWKDY